MQFRARRRGRADCPHRPLLPHTEHVSCGQQRTTTAAHPPLPCVALPPCPLCAPSVLLSCHVRPFPEPCKLDCRRRAVRNPLPPNFLSFFSSIPFPAASLKKPPRCFYHSPLPASPSQQCHSFCVLWLCTRPPAGFLVFLLEMPAYPHHPLCVFQPTPARRACTAPVPGPPLPMPARMEPSLGTN